MDIDVRTTTNTVKGKKKLPVQFAEQIRPDLIKRAVEAIRSNKRQPYGASPTAGKRASAELSRRRQTYRGSYGFGISRVPRKILSRRGRRMHWVGAFAPGTVGGRRAHPPKAEKIWTQKINVKERRKAIRSAISATMYKQIVEERGHKVPENYPFILDTGIESLKTTKEVKSAFEKLGFTSELKRASVKKIRAGKGTMRNRPYRRKIGPLLVVSNEECSLFKAANNIPGVEIVSVNLINAELLAPGSDIGRLTLFTEAAIDRLDKEALFTKDYKKPKEEKKVEK